MQTLCIANLFTNEPNQFGKCFATGCIYLCINWDAQHVIKVKWSLQIITTVNSVPAHIVSNILDKRSLRNSK